MKPDKISEAIGQLDDELIESADKRRCAPRTVRLRPARIFSSVACVCIAAAAVIVTARLWLPTASDGAPPHDNVAEDTIGDNSPGIYDGAKGGVTIAKTVITESFGKKDDATEYFSYGGRIYTLYRPIEHGNISDIVGEHIGRVTNIFENEPRGDYYGELCGNMSRDIYIMKEYDPEFMLAADVDGTFYTFICDNGITLEKGSELFSDRLKLEGGYSSLYYHLSGSTHYLEPLREEQYASVDGIIASLYDAPVVLRDELKSLLIDATLYFSHNSGTTVSLCFYEGGYVSLDMGAFSGVCVKLDEEVYANHIRFFRAVSFDPADLAELIPNESAEVLFYHRIFASSTYLYFCHSEATPAELIVYYTNDFGDTLGRIVMALPDYIECDSAVPIYAGHGGGSGECEFILRLTRGDTIEYVSFNNFSYTTDNLDFEFGDYVDEAYLNDLPVDNFHVSEFLTEVMPSTAPNGVYMVEGSGKKLIISTPSDASMEMLLAYFEIERGQNPAYGNEYHITVNVLSPEECSTNNKYFIHTSAGDVVLTDDEALRVLQKSGASISHDPFYMIDEFGNSVEVKIHRIEGVTEKLVTAEPLIFTVDGFKYQPNQSSLRLDVTTLTEGYVFTSTESYLPLRETLVAMGYTVECVDGKILATGEYYSENWRFNAPRETDEAPEIEQVYIPTSMPTVSVNGKSAEYQGRVLQEFKFMSSMVTQYSFNDLIIYDGEYYIKPEFLAYMLDMDTDYQSAFYTKSDK